MRIKCYVLRDYPKSDYMSMRWLANKVLKNKKIAVDNSKRLNSNVFAS